MSNQNTSTPMPARSRRGPWPLILIALFTIAGVFAGVRWHDSLERLFGARADSGASASHGLWTCGMHPQVIQDHPGTCPICHMDLTPLKVDDAAVAATGAAPMAAAPAQPDRKIKYWWDPMMNPPYISDKPGKSPMGMDLVPVYEDQAAAPAPGTVTIDPAIVQNMGVRTATVTQGPLDRAVRLVGYLDEAQPNIQDINLRVSGWIRRLEGNTEGMRVRKGDPLFELYSPDLQVAVEELISSRRARNMGGQGAAEGIVAGLYDAAARKLELYGLEKPQIDVLAKLDKAPDTITFTSPIDGDITERLVVEGGAVKAGDRVLRIVDHSTLWLDARVFEQDLAMVHVGQTATAKVSSRPGQPIEGQVIFVDPRVDPMTRTTIARLAVPNPTLALKPGMYATVQLGATLAESAVLAPREAVIDTGEGQVAFVAKSGGLFEPRTVHMGMAGENDMVQILDGLSPGETVVTSGQFLLDSESRLREAVQKFLSERKQAAIPTHAAPAASSALPGLQQKVDAVAATYLAISTVLGAVEKDSTPLDPSPLVNAARALEQAGSGDEVGPLAADVAKSAEAMQGAALDRQREAFKEVSQKMIAMSRVAAPSAAVGEALYIMHCPMAKADWMQGGKEVANPYYATQMKSCGSVTSTIAARKEPQR